MHALSRTADGRVLPIAGVKLGVGRGLCLAAAIAILSLLVVGYWTTPDTVPTIKADGQDYRRRPPGYDMNLP